MIAPMKGCPDRIVCLLYSLFQHVRTKHWGHGCGQYDRGWQREGISVRHRGEDDTLDALHREQRQEGDYENQRRIEHRTADLDGSAADAMHFVLACRNVGWQEAKYILDHDDGGIDDQAECNRS